MLTESLRAAFIWWPASFSIVGCQKNTLLFLGAAAGILVSAGELYSGLGDTSSFDVSGDLMIKWQRDLGRRDDPVRHPHK